jgi:SAM-dependent methyltransferase
VWPRKGDKLTVLADEDHLPLADNTVDKLLVVHCLEGTERVNRLLREIWRVLAPQGRVMLIVPNRRSVWARSDSTPFGHGRPFSRQQLHKLLNDAMFSTTGWQYALHAPPISHKLVLRSITGLERVGASLWPGIGGVIMVEGRKELMAPTGRVKAAPALGRLVTVPSPRIVRDSS